MLAMLHYCFIKIIIQFRSISQIVFHSKFYDLLILLYITDQKNGNSENSLEKKNAYLIFN